MKKLFTLVIGILCSLHIYSNENRIVACGVTFTQQNVLCNGACNGSATATGNGGTSPYAYSWSTTPAQLTPSATGLCAGSYTVTVTDGVGCIATGTVTITQPSAMFVTTTKTNVNCFGGATGTANASAFGGSAPYTYSWSPSGGNAAAATGLLAGTYTVTVTDGTGCTKTATAAISQPAAPLAATFTSTNILCNGLSTGTATANPTGGTTAYTYSWSSTPSQTTKTANALPPGTYTCMVTDKNGCVVIGTTTITQPPPFTTSTTSTTSACAASTGTATVTAAGGTPAYTYSWATTPSQTTSTATALPVGTYSVTVTDANGCTSKSTASVTNPGAPAITTSVTNVTCNAGTDGTATANVTGGTPTYTYSWIPTPGAGQGTPTATGLAAGTYTIAVADISGCASMTTVLIAQPAPIIITTTKVNVLCFGNSTGSATANVTGGTPAYSYTWTPSGGSAATATGLIAGTYTVTVTDINGCTKSAPPVNITQPVTPLSSTTTQANVSCNGGATGTATANPAGGSPPYTYSWSSTPPQTSKTAGGLIAGTYTCIVTDKNGCQVINTVTITQPSAITVATAMTSSSCAGSTGTATATASGGTGTLLYSWNTTPPQLTAIATAIPAGIYTVTVTDGNACTKTASITVTNTGGPSITTSGTNENCNAGNTGTANVVATGGTPAYTYSWTPSGGTAASASALLAGTYTIVVTDAGGCTATGTVTVTQPTAITATTSKTNVLCNGGSSGTATANVSGGTIPYTYSWSSIPAQSTQTATGLPTGLYTVTVTDAKGCTKTATANITQPALLTTTTVPANETCFGGTSGSAATTPAGGSFPYTYSWNTVPAQTVANATALAAGTYTVTVTDSKGCTVTSTATITQPATIVVSASSTSTGCGTSTGTATAVASGGTGTLGYTWNSTPPQTTPTATGLPTGLYVVTIHDANGCTKTANTTVNSTGGPALTATGTNVSCNLGTDGTANVVATGGTPAYTYAWSPSGGTAASATGLSAGTYTITVTDAGNCSSSASVTITQPGNIGGPVTKTNVTCFGGNDGSASITLSGGTPAYTYSWNTTPAQTTANATGLAAGTYTLNITDSKGCIRSGTVTITQPPVLSVTTTQQNEICFNSGTGSVSTTTTGGTGPYTYSWNTIPVQTSANATGLTAGAYTVTVKDASGCSTTASATITQPVAIAGTTSTTQTGCGTSVGSATVTASGGTGTLTYSWNSAPPQTTAAATALPAGAYSVLVKDANGCTMTASATVTSTGGPALVATGTNVSCNGGTNGTGSVTATGGTPNYTFSWTPSGGTTANATGLAAGSYTISVNDAGNCLTTAVVVVTEPTVIALAMSATSATCNGSANGSATVSPTGGTPGYTYSWKPAPGSGQGTANATGLASGVYTVTVTDSKGCSQTGVTPVNEPAALSASVTQSAVTCNGGTNGSATVSPGGGTLPYTYSWNTPAPQTTPTATGLISGTYSVTLTDSKGCTITAGIVVTEPTAISASASATTSGCGVSTGTATATAGGGTGTLTYSWNSTPPQTTTIATALPVGNYTVTVTDANGCIKTASASVTNTGAPALTVTPVNVKCFGGSDGTATVNATGGTPTYTYSWTPAGGTAALATGLTAGTYTITVKDGANCATVSTTSVAEPLALAVTATATNVSCGACTDGTATANVTGGTTLYTYSWNSVPSQSTQVATGLGVGTFTCTVTDANGCTASANAAVSSITGITTAVLTDSYKVYPNPASGFATVELQSSRKTQITLSLVNLVGQELIVKSLELNGTLKQNLDLTGLPVGLYFVTIQTPNGKTIQKLIVR